MNKNIITTRKLAQIGLFTSVALIFSYIEKLISFDFVAPGVKIGLANIVIIIALYYFSNKFAFCVNIIRIIIVGLLFGNIFSFIISILGAIFSFIFMVYSKKSKLFSIIGVSIIGGVTHNLGQITGATIVLNSFAVISYLPFLILMGIIMGAINGIISNLILKKLPKF